MLSSLLSTMSRLSCLSPPATLENKNIFISSSKYFNLPVTSDDCHVIHTGLIAVGQLLKTDLGLSVHWVLTLGLYFWPPLYSEKCTMIIVYSYRFLPLLCLSFGSNKSIAIPLAICSPT